MPKRKKRLNIRSMKIFIDGSCRPSTGFGGFAILIVKDNGKRLVLKGTEEKTTNNIMEIRALIETLKFIIEHKLDSKYEIEIFSDSQYVVKGINEWWVKWKSKNYKTSTGTVVKNLDLWKELEILTKLVKCRLTWTRGHSTNALHNEVDKIVYELTGSLQVA